MQYPKLPINSIHTKACFKAILSGVYKRLSKLTTITDTNKNLPLDKIYPQHFQALQHAGLVTKKVPRLNNYNITKKPKLLNKLRTIPTTNATEEGQPTFVSDILTSGPNQSIQSSNLSKTNSIFNG